MSKHPQFYRNDFENIFMKKEEKIIEFDIEPSISFTDYVFIFHEFMIIMIFLNLKYFNSLPPDDLCYSVLNSYLSNHYISMVTRTMLAYDFCFVFITLSA